MPARLFALLLLALGGIARAASAESAPVQQPVDAGTGFRLEGRPAIDDVFGDASDYRRTVDRFLELTAQMQAMRDEFARSVQVALNELGTRGADKRTSRRRGCPVDTVAVPYARAHHLGSEYLRVGREL